MTRTIGFVAIALCASAASAQTATMPPHANNFSGNTRGYWFTAPVSFTITGVQVMQAPGGANQFMNWSIIRFNGAVPPPTFPTTTNAFTQLAFGLNEPSNAFSPTSLQIFAGDVIGIYGNTMAASGAATGVNSYTAAGVQATTTVFGNVINLARSGMQFHLGSATSPAGMHDVWAEPTSMQVSRVEFTYTEIPAPGALGLLCGAGLLAFRRRR
jgi:hypothetical protein